MIKKVLIVNRGEISKRIKSSLDLLGIESLGLYQPRERNASWLRNVGGISLEKSDYLSIQTILKVIKQENVDAVHPGYGFLSENAQFVQELVKNKITFIGPNPRAMYMMGDKIESKRVATQAGLKVIPGFDGVITSPELAIKHANDIGYPVMIKASAGGGGKGIKIVSDDEGMFAAFNQSSAEALKLFKDSRLLIEKYISNSRHVEIQLIGDKHGNCVYLPERECSIQRRNQKVIEESPSAILDESTRSKLGEQAVSLAKAVGYDSAGTCEFLLDLSTGEYYFLEMNTRIQVEHPITELVTGLDIVQLMINSAQGHHLPITQDDVCMNGWAMETRVCAEDAKFLPFAGTLKTYIEPANPNMGDSQKSKVVNNIELIKTEGGIIRCDSGVEQGSEITVFYDSLICKVSTSSKTREGCIELMKNALDSYVIEGVVNNIPLLRDILENENFVKGEMDTGFLSREYPDGFQGRRLTDLERMQVLSVAAAVYLSRAMIKNDNPSNEIFLSIDNGESHHLTVEGVGNGEYLINNQFKANLNDWSGYEPIIHADINGIKRIMQFSNPTPLGFSLRFIGTLYTIKVYTPLQHSIFSSSPQKIVFKSNPMAINSPMPGIIVSSSIRVGERVKKGDVVCVIEAMKMQNAIKSPVEGEVESIGIRKGDIVRAGHELVRFK